MDGGGDQYMSSKTNQYLKAHIIIREVTPSYTLELTLMAIYGNKHIADIIKVMHFKLDLYNSIMQIYMIMTLIIDK